MIAKQTSKMLVAVLCLLSLVSSSVVTAAPTERVFGEAPEADYSSRNKGSGFSLDNRFGKKPKTRVANRIVLADSSPVSIVKQFEDTSYYLKDICLLNENLGWAVGEPHWDQAQKQYVGTIIKTLDGGTTWTPQGTGVSETLRGVAFVDANRGWAVGANGTILHTEDGGAHWVRQIVATTDEFRGVVFIDVNNGWATSIQVVHYDSSGEADDWRGSIWHTGNGGSTWTKQSIPDNTSILNRIDFIDANNGWAVGVQFTGYEYGEPQHMGAVYHTRNGGQTWEEQYSPNLEFVFTGVDFTDANNGWVTAFKGKSDLLGGLVFHTIDGGTNWTNPIYVDSIQGFGNLDDYFDILWDVHFVDQNHGYVVGFNYASGTAPVWRTMDGGVSWQCLSPLQTEGEGVFAIAIAGNRAITVGDHDYVGISLNPWGSPPGPGDPGLFNSTYINTHHVFNGVFFTDANHGWAVGKRSFGKPYSWGQIILNTQDGGMTWQTQYQQAPFGDLSSNFQIDGVFFTDRQNGWAVGSSDFDLQDFTDKGAMLYTTDGGLNWQEQGSELYGGRNLTIKTIQFLDSQKGWALRANGTSTGYLARTVDGGLHWAWVDTGITNTPGGLGSSDLTFTDPQQAWALLDRGNVIHTQNGGQTWIKQPLCVESYGCTTTIYAIGFADHQHGWVVGDYPYQTTDGGVHWLRRERSSHDILDIQFLNRSWGWIVGEIGTVRFTDDSGNTWINVNNEIYADLRGLSFINPQTGWAVGNYGTILTVTGNPDDVDGDGLANAVDPDGDGDGMTDIWEQAYGLNPQDTRDAAFDQDGDGLSNGQEYQASTNPLVDNETTCPGADVVLVNRTYTAGQVVQCIASASIRAGLPVTVAAGADVTYTAPRIMLLPNFTVQAGGTFRAGHAP